MNTLTLTAADALARYLRAQQIEIDGQVQGLFGCVFAIFGHGNVTCLSQPLREGREQMPVWRGQNEQSMALAAVAYAKANRRRRIGVAISSIGPGATNMVTAAAVAHTNRLPLLLISGDVHVGRLPDPVLQQVEHFHDPSLTVNDSFKPVVRYWDRVVTPAQLLQTLPQAVGTLLVITLIVTPAAIARLVSARIPVMIAVACATSTVGGCLGLGFSYETSVHLGWRVAGGPAIAVGLTLMFLVVSVGRHGWTFLRRRHSQRAQHAQPDPRAHPDQRAQPDPRAHPDPRAKPDQPDQQARDKQVGPSPSSNSARGA